MSRELILFQNGLSVANITNLLSAGTGNFYTLNGLTSGTQYCYTIRAYDTLTEVYSLSAYANTLCVTTLSGTKCLTITTAITGTGSGKIGTSVGSDNRSPGNYLTNAGEIITLYATPNINNMFTGWVYSITVTGATTGVNNSITFTMPASSVSLSAGFIYIPPTTPPPPTTTLPPPTTTPPPPTTTPPPPPTTTPPPTTPPPTTPPPPPPTTIPPPPTTPPPPPTTIPPPPPTTSPPPPTTSPP